MIHKVLTAVDAGYAMKCTGSITPEFVPGKVYMTLHPDHDFIGEGCPAIGDSWVLNYQNRDVYGIEGTKLVATFKMIRDNKGKLVRRDTDPKLTVRNGRLDKRRVRRFLRQCEKVGVGGRGMWRHI